MPAPIVTIQVNETTNGRRAFKEQVEASLNNAVAALYDEIQDIPSGPRGEQGLQGEKGDTGEKGKQGIQGPKGENGEAPVITVAEDTPRSYKLHFQSGEQELTTPRTAHRAHRRLRKFRGAPVKGPSLDSRQFSARKKAAAEHSCSGLFRFSYRVRTRPSNSHT